MTAPRLDIALDKIRHNAHTLIARLGRRGIAVTGVTKATLGAPAIATALLQAGVTTLGDSRIENLETMRGARVQSSMTLLRSPMLSQVDRVVAHADVSFNTELVVIRALASAAKAVGRTHGIVLMVELGDLREGIMPGDLETIVRETLRLPNLAFRGIGTNLACRSGVAPDATNMAELSALADAIETTFGCTLDLVSGGNSGNLRWALGDDAPGRINDLRLGESILLGRETLHREPIEGLYTDAITLTAEVIESKVKPSQPWGEIAQSAFGETPRPPDRGPIAQAILGVGRQDTDADGLRPSPGITVLGASSDHLIVDAGDRRLTVGSEVTFQLDYSALVRAMTSPYVAKVMSDRSDGGGDGGRERRRRTVRRPQRTT
jgi:predicted amino acid racemase